MTAFRLKLLIYILLTLTAAAAFYLKDTGQPVKWNARQRDAIRSMQNILPDEKTQIK